MKDIDIEMLSAYLDQELSLEESNAVELRLKHEEKLRMIYRQMSEGSEAIRQSIHLIDEEPLTTKLSALLGSLDQAKPDAYVSPIGDFKSSIIGSSKAGETKPGMLTRWFGVLRTIGANSEVKFNWSFNATAVVVLLVAVGFFVNESGQQPSIMQLNVGDSLNELNVVMNHSVSGSSTKLMQVTIKQELAFMPGKGALCKRYSAIDGEATVNAVACYQRQEWVVAVTESTHYRDSENTEAPYAPASVISGSLVDEYIEKHIENIPLTHEEERNLLNQLQAK